MSQRTGVRLAAVAFLVVLPAAAAAWLWFAPPGADVPDYGSRAGRFITWAADSSAAGGEQLVLAVP
jgi:hypothetical protein